MDVPKKPFEAIAFLHQDMTKTSFGFTKLALSPLCEAVRGRARPCEAVRARTGHKSTRSPRRKSTSHSSYIQLQLHARAVALHD